MECLSPILSTTTLHGRLWLPCGKCNPCKQRKGRDWFIRLKKEFDSTSLPSYFITLTYDNENIPIVESDDDNTVNIGFDKKAVQLFIQQIKNFTRQGVPKKFRPKRFEPFEGEYNLKYFAIAEYGGLFNRPHYHILMFGLKWNKENTVEIIEKLWNYGFIDVGEVNDKSICYITDYMVTKDEKTEWRIMSKGLGSDYIETHKKYHASKMDFKVPIFDREYNMPRYYRKKIFNEAERLKIGKNIVKEMDEKFPDRLETIHERAEALRLKIQFKREKRDQQKWSKYSKSINKLKN